MSVNLTINDFGASGGSHSSGVVPDPGSTAGTSKFLREDSTWAVPGNSEQFFYDIAPACAVSSGQGWPPSIVQLSGGGNAVLSTPAGKSIDGKIFKIKLAGRIATDSSSSYEMVLSLGTSGQYGDLCSVSVPASLSVGTFFVSFDFSWDSVAQIAYNKVGPYFVSAPSVFSIGGFNSLTPSIASMSNVAFVVKAGTGSGLSNTCSATITQFSIEV